MLMILMGNTNNIGDTNLNMKATGETEAQWKTRVATNADALPAATVTAQLITTGNQPATAKYHQLGVITQTTTY